MQRLTHRAGNIDEARELYVRLLDLARTEGDPKTERTVLLRALALFPSDAEVIGEILESLDPEDIEDSADELITAVERLVQQARDAGRLADEKRWIERKIELSGGNSSPADLERLAELAGETRNRQEQLDVLLRLIQTRREREGVAPALEQAQAVVKAFPLDARPRELIVELLRELDETELLVEEIVTLGDLAVSKRSWSRAEMYFREAMELDPSRLDILERFAQSYEERGDGPTAARHYLKLANVYNERGDSAEALRCAHRCADLNPNGTEHLSLLLELEEKTHHRREAAQTALRLAEHAVARGDAADLGAMSTKVTKLAPQNAEHRLRLAELHAQLDLLAKASKHFAAAAELLHDSDRVDEAERACREALTINPELLAARQLLLKIQEVEGDNEGTVESLRSLAVGHSSEGNLAEAVSSYERLPRTQSARPRGAGRLVGGPAPDSGERKRPARFCAACAWRSIPTTTGTSWSCTGVG